MNSSLFGRVEQRFNTVNHSTEIYFNIILLLFYCYFTLFYFALFYFLLRYFILFILRYFILFYVILFYFTLF
jgi:hypothetical protein